MGDKWLKKEDERGICERYLSGESLACIARDIDYSKTTILNVLKRNNIERRFKDRPLKEYEENVGGKNVRKIPPKEEILLRFVYLRDEGKLLHKRTLKETRPSKHGYKICSFGALDGKQIRYKEHRLIFFLETGEQPEEVDHIDGNKLNNHISNLRGVSAEENARNRKSHKNKKYKGVSFIRDCKINPWRMTLRIGGKTYIGVFETELEAARAYNKAALEHFGEFAYLNVFEDETEEN